MIFISFAVNIVKFEVSYLMADKLLMPFSAKTSHFLQGILYLDCILL